MTHDVTRPGQNRWRPGDPWPGDICFELLYNILYNNKLYNELYGKNPHQIEGLQQFCSPTSHSAHLSHILQLSSKQLGRSQIILLDDSSTGVWTTRPELLLAIVSMTYDLPTIRLPPSHAHQARAMQQKWTHLVNFVK